MTWQPTWRRVIASTLVVFALVLAVLVWRVEAGDDPALGAARTATPEPAAASPSVPDAGQGTPALPGSGAPSDPGTGVPSGPDTAVPAGPSTHVS
jgi:hypothetical protein